MTRAFILIEIVAGYSQSLVNDLRGQEGITDVVRVTGPMDAIATVEADTLEQVRATVGNKIHSLEGVVRTTTCIAID